MDNDLVLICGANWLGDSIMTMPAIQSYRRLNPGVVVVLLVKPNMAPLWDLHPGIDRVLVCVSSIPGTFRAAAAVRRVGCRAAYILPNSFRSTLIPFLAGVPERIGADGHQRSWMLTRRIRHDAADTDTHQALEYYAILGVSGAGAIESPKLVISPELDRCVRMRFGLESGVPYVALMPGAARGPSKRWPSERFMAVGRSLAAQGASVLVLGSPSEVALCEPVARGVGCPCLAGKTTLKELAAVLSLCAVSVTNDSGGMHLASAVGSRVVAVYGVTDARKTGPLGDGHRVLQAPDVCRSRDVARDSVEACRALRAVSADDVSAAAQACLSQVHRTG
jgi:heptosyltransferase-2